MVDKITFNSLLSKKSGYNQDEYDWLISKLKDNPGFWPGRKLFLRLSEELEINDTFWQEQKQLFDHYLSHLLKEEKKVEYKNPTPCKTEEQKEILENYLKSPVYLPDPRQLLL